MNVMILRESFSSDEYCSSVLRVSPAREPSRSSPMPDGSAAHSNPVDAKEAETETLIELFVESAQETSTGIRASRRVDGGGYICRSPAATGNCPHLYTYPLLFHD